MKVPVLDTQAAWHEYLVRLALEAWDRTVRAPEQSTTAARLRAERRLAYEREVRERMAQASMVVVCEIELARGGER